MAMDKVEPIIEEYFDEMPDLFSFSLARWDGKNNSSKIEKIQNAKINFLSKIIPQFRKFFKYRPKVTLDHMNQFLKEFE